MSYPDEPRIPAPLGRGVVNSADFSPLAKSALSRADQALYRAKQQGRDQCASFDLRVQRKCQRLERIKKAIAGGEFEPWYQPIVRANGFSVAGYEALARWRDGEEVVPPDQFILLLENSRNLHLLDRVLFRQIARDRQKIAPLWISANLSPATIDCPDFAEIIKPLLFDKKSPIEITERMVLSVGARLELGRLRMAGYLLKLDDFGSGQSRLAELASGLVSGIKIDKSIVQLLSTSKGKKLCGALISMAHKLDLAVIAEGVEVAAQAEVLQRAGCDYLQGFLFGQPKPLKEWV